MSTAQFSEEEIQHLFQRAAALQAAGDEASHRPRLSSAELEAIAEQAGIAPRYVRQAIAEHQQPSVAEAEAEASATHVFIEQQVDAPLTDEVWDGIVSYLRLRYDTDLGDRFGMTQAGDTGYGKSATEKSGSARYWTHVSVMGIETRVSAVPEGAQMRLMLSRRVGMGGPVVDAGLLGLLPAVLVFVFASQAIASLPAVLLALVMFAGATGLAHVIGSHWRTRQTKELRELAAILATRLGTTGTASVSDAQTATARRTADADLSLGDFEEVPPVQGHGRSAKQRRSRA